MCLTIIEFSSLCNCFNFLFPYLCLRMNTVLGPGSDVLGDSLAHYLGEVYLCLGLPGC